MTRVFSGIQPSGNLHLGSLLGAVRNWVTGLGESDSLYCVVDLHALTLRPDPAALRSDTIRVAQALMACGLDPEQCTLFVQSHVPQHVELGWIMECTASFGELNRMVQFKDKSGRVEFVSAGLFTYPALQASDILLYDTDEVPVGADQRQHIELTRDLAIRFNNRYGDTFVVPQHVIPPTGARVMDLQNPTVKMSKSADAAAGTIELLEDLKSVEKKFKRAVTDSESDVRYDVEAKPGISNLLEILGGATGRKPADLANDYTQYGRLKVDAAEAVIELLRPIQQRFAELEGDPAETARLLSIGGEKAQAMAEKTMLRTRDALGLLPR